MNALEAYSCAKGKKIREQNPPSLIITGDLLQVKIPSTRIHLPPSGARGKVTHFTNSSRLRMLKMTATLDWGKLPNPLFTTCTYPDDVVPMTQEEAKLHRDLMIRSMENYLKVKLPIIWRSEWMPRLSGKRVGEWCPHLHMLVFTARRIEMHDFNEMWKANIKWGEYCRTEVERVKRGDQAGYYVSKYCAKVDSASSSLVNHPYRSRGRHWGVRRPNYLIKHTPLHIDGLNEEELWCFVRAGARAMSGFAKWGLSSFSLFGEAGREALEKFWEKRVDKYGQG